MSQIQGATSTESYHRGHKPWSEQKRAVPLRTYSGAVVYKRAKHVWHVKDLERISKNVEIDVDDSNPNWLEEALQKIKELTIRMMGVLLPFLSDSQVSGLYQFIYDLLMKIFNVPADVKTSGRSTAENLIYALAGKFGLEVTIKRL